MTNEKKGADEMQTTINNQDMKGKDIKEIEACLTPEHREVVQRFDQVLNAYKEEKAFQEKKRFESFFKRIIRGLRRL
jgi:peptide deformylase